MNLPDFINGCFEISGGFFNAINIAALYRAKVVRGVHWAPSAVFSLWGWWNLYFYAYVHQPLSWWGGLGLVLTNSIWVGMALYYIKPSNGAALGFRSK
jgi:hypothetical protein